MISFVDVTKIFKPDRVLFENINFDINDGDFVFITGISGSGKTTLLNLMLKADSLTEGDIVFNGQSLNALKKRHIPRHRQQVGVVFQDYKLINEKTVAENIALPLEIAKTPKDETKQRVDELLHLINLEDRANYFPKQLSGGEAQRVGIARALATAPAVIFADEPTGNLDYRASLGIAKLLKKINDWGTTIIISTHDPKLLDIIKGARHLHLQNGQIIECAASSEVLLNEHKTRAGKPAHRYQMPTENDIPDDDLNVEGDLAVAAPPRKVMRELEIDEDQCEKPPARRSPGKWFKKVAKPAAEEVEPPVMEDLIEDDTVFEEIDGPPRVIRKPGRTKTEFQEEVLS